MQAVIALCHFCESHGPRVLVTCQPMRSLPMTITSSTDTLKPTNGTNFSTSLPSVSTDLNDLPVYYGDCTRAVYDIEERCGACTSYGDGPCLLSNDHENKTTYISSQVALKEHVFDRVASACLRSLSSEITVPSQDQDTRPVTQPLRIGVPSTSAEPEIMDLESVRKKDGYLMFGDTDSGFCLAYAFRLQDSRARGFLRLFSLVIVTHDMASMTAHHDFFVDALHQIKNRLQAQCNTVYQREVSSEHSMRLDLMRPEYASLASRLQVNNFRDRIRIDTTRNLQQITGDDNIWCSLHRQMMWTLRTQTLRFEDRVMEGVPTQDMLVLMEMEHADIVELDLHQPNQAEITLSQLKNLKIIAVQLAEKDEGDLELLLRHLIFGGQIIVESYEQLLGKQVLLALSNLLPIGCLRINTHGDQYYPSQRFNLLGLSREIVIPGSVIDALVLRVSCNGEPKSTLDNCWFEILRRPVETASYNSKPLVLERYKYLLLDSEIHDHVLEATLRSARETFMSRAKLLYQLEEQRERDPRMTTGDLMHLIRGCTEQDRPALSFWQGGLSKAYKNYVIRTIQELQHLSS